MTRAAGVTAIATTVAKTGIPTERAYMRYEGYCVKCRMKREFEGKEEPMKNGGLAAKGTCPACGTKITRLLPRKKKVKSPA